MSRYYGSLCRYGRQHFVDHCMCLLLVIRSVLEYACAVWHPVSPKKIISRYWVCSKALIVSSPVIQKKNLNLNLKSKEMVLRPTYQYQLPLSKTSRDGRDFIPCMQHIKDVLDCFRLDLLLLLLVLLVLLLCACVCVCFNLLSDNESNIILSFGIL